MVVKNHDMQHSIVETELKAENRSLATRIDVLMAQKGSKKSKLKHLKKQNQELKRHVSELEFECGRSREDGERSSMPPPQRKTRHSTVN